MARQVAPNCGARERVLPVISAATMEQLCGQEVARGQQRGDHPVTTQGRGDTMSDRGLYTSTSGMVMEMFLVEIGLTTGMTVVDGPGEVVTGDDASRTSALRDAGRQIVQLVGGPMVWRLMLIGWSRTVDGERSEETTAVGVKVTAVVTGMNDVVYVIVWVWEMVITEMTRVTTAMLTGVAGRGLQ